MGLFDKCYDYNITEIVKEKGIYPYFRPIQESEGPVVMMEGKQGRGEERKGEKRS